MTKHKFTFGERYAVWKHHGQKCFLCEEPLRIQDTSVDHLIPESLLDKPEELKRVRNFYRLPEEFEINDYCNWVPVHTICNQKKATATFRLSPANQIVIDRLLRDQEKVRKIEERIKNNVKADETLARLIVAKEGTEIDPIDVQALEILNEEEQTRTSGSDQHKIHVDKGRWKIIEVRGEVATVTDGRLGGLTPVGKNPDFSWHCPTCGSYGPWNGVICLSCGRKSDPYD